MMALAVVIFALFLLEEGGKSRWFNWAGLLMCGFMLAMSQSRTAWVTTMALLMFIPMLRFLRGGRLPMSLRVGSLLILGFAWPWRSPSSWSSGLKPMGRDLTFTGRTTIWAYAIHRRYGSLDAWGRLQGLLDTRRGELRLCPLWARGRQRP